MSTHFHGRIRPRARLPVLQALTLTERLVVIAIIAVLAASLFPVISRVRGKSQGIFCLNNLKQLGFSWPSYAHDNEDKIPRTMGINRQASFRQ